MGIHPRYDWTRQRGWEKERERERERERELHRMKQREEKKLEREGETGRQCRTVGKLKLFLHLKWKHSDTEMVTRTRDDDSFSVVVLHQVHHVSPYLVNVDRLL